jgi:hypothetical protein
LQKPPRPAGSESPLEFDAYTLNHAAFVGTQETAWVTDFEQELTRRGVFVVKGAAQIIYRVRKSTMCPVCPLGEIFGQLCKKILHTYSTLQAMYSTLCKEIFNVYTLK